MLDLKKLLTKILQTLPTLAPKASPTFTGTVKIPTIKLGSESNITSWVDFFKTIPDSSISDANDAPSNSSCYIGSDDTAATISNLPNSTAGHLITFGTGGTVSGKRVIQLYFNRNAYSTPYLRNNRTGTWSNWRRILTQAISPSWSSMTASGATLSSGGYYEEGKHVYVSLQCKLSSAGSSGTNVTLFTGLPNAKITSVLSVMVGSALNGVAWATTGGSLILKPSASVSTSTTITINGVYTAAD